MSLPESAHRDTDFLPVSSSVVAPGLSRRQVRALVSIEVRQNPARIKRAWEIGSLSGETQPASRQNQEQDPQHARFREDRTSRRYSGEWHLEMKTI